eukprot:CAMPEP_0183369108 /NCGR_PEP_ID=MMETSP0164_2-20130417/98288_1 /TAXON_ID=221442 /ORGANISM="Coccolithus pelagicus ssp braarudi, Strain PLY182g" /LENGTH=57 /DNA_ID=CAMNT_0025545315 /DNA_START=136 /DNA_END=306 /DNA_ORIENTATION=-
MHGYASVLMDALGVALQILRRVVARGLARAPWSRHAGTITPQHEALFVAPINAICIC